MVDSNDTLRTNNAELGSQTGRIDEEFQNLRDRFENLTGTSSEPSLSKKRVVEKGNIKEFLIKELSPGMAVVKAYVK